MVHSLFGHEDSIFVLNCHPIDDRILLSAGYDGKIVIWNLEAGKMIISIDNAMKQFLDGQFSEDGFWFAVTDYEGGCALFSVIGTLSLYEPLPVEQFFGTDYMPLTRDINQYVIDETSQLPPHLIPRQPLCDIRGEIYKQTPHCLPGISLEIDDNILIGAL